MRVQTHLPVHTAPELRHNARAHVHFMLRTPNEYDRLDPCELHHIYHAVLLQSRLAPRSVRKGGHFRTVPSGWVQQHLGHDINGSNSNKSHRPEYEDEDRFCIAL